MPRYRKRWLAVAAAVIVAAGLGLTAIPAFAEPGTGSITGQLLDEGSPVPEITVSLYDLDFNTIQESITDQTGAFAFADVAIGDYKLGFSLPGFVTQFYRQQTNFDEADTVTVAEGETTTIQESLLPHGAIAGRLTNADGSPAPFPHVLAIAVDGSFLAQTNGDADGNYSIDFVLAGTYRVAFRTSVDSPTQYAHQKTSEAAADPIEVVAGETTTLNEILLPTGTLRGRFTDAGAPIPFASVTAHSRDTSDSQLTSTDHDGLYEVSVWPGDYIIEFSRDNGLFQYAHQKRDLNSADIFTVAAGAEVVVDEEAIPTGIIAGRLTDADGAPVAGASVSVESDSVFGGASTDEDGHYQAQVYSGDYRVSFHTGVGRQWARGKTSAGTADPITVVAGQTTVLDEVLNRTGSVTITARDAATGAAIGSFCADLTGIFDIFCTNDGSIGVPALPGQYRVGVFPDDLAYLSTSISPVQVASNEETTVVAELARGATIRTSIQDAVTGEPIGNACVEPVRPLRPTSLGAGGARCADENGEVTIDQLEAGTYNLFAWARDSEHGHQWVGPSGGTGAQAKGKVVTVEAGQTITVAPIRLDRAGSITGTVTDAATGEPLGEAAVGLASFSAGFGGTEASVFTDTEGRYTWSGLGPYDWVLFFKRFDRAAQWSGGTSNRFLAKGVPVEVGQATIYNQALRRGATVSATVLGPGGAPVSFARITAINAVTGDEMGNGDCASPEPCLIPLLGPQGIKLMYDASTNGEFYSGWHLDAEDFLHATTVLVPPIGRQVTVTASRLVI